MCDDTDKARRNELNNQQQQGGIGCGGVITIVLVLLKALGVPPVAYWSWWLVTCLVWGPLLIGAVFLLIMAALAFASR
jgi:hypothetical protein